MSPTFLDALRTDAKRYGGRGTLLSLLKVYLYCPGFKLSFGYRLARLAHRHGHRRLATMIANRYQRLTACQISPQAEIGPGCYFPHALGIVIGENVQVGPGATIYHHVTLGRRRSDRPDYPVIGADVILYTGASVFGNVAIATLSHVPAYKIVLPKHEQSSSSAQTT